MAQITELKKYRQRNQDQTETEFANGILEENEDLLTELVRVSGGYAENGRADKFYILTKAINLTLNLAQSHMKHTLSRMQGEMN